MVILNKICVNSVWIADFLANDEQECCECFGHCKVKVKSKEGMEYILTEKEIEDLKHHEEQKLPITLNIISGDGIYWNFIDRTNEESGIACNDTLYIPLKGDGSLFELLKWYKTRYDGIVGTDNKKYMDIFKEGTAEELDKLIKYIVKR